MRRRHPRASGRAGRSSLATVAAILAVGGALLYALAQETPRGAVEGRVVLAASGEPMRDAEVVLVPAEDNAGGARWRTRAGAGGRFRLPGLPAGGYQISVATRAHELGWTLLYVAEGETARVELALKRSNPELALSQHQWVYGTREEARIGVRGYVDPTRPPGTDSLSLRVYRTRLSQVLRHRATADALQEAGRAYDPPPGLPRVLLDGSHAPRPAVFLHGHFRIRTADREGFYFQRLSLGRLQPGLYLIEVAHSDSPALRRNLRLDARTPATRRVCAWLTVTDTALVVKQAPPQLVAFAVDMRTGAPLPGARVTAWRAGAALAQASTGTDGLAEMRVPTPPRGEDSPLMVAVSRGADEAVVDSRGYYDEERGAYAVHAYTDRPIYRPGQTVYYKGILRRAVEPGSRYTVPRGVPVALEIRDPSGERVLQARHQASPRGSFWGRAELNPEAPAGVYSLIATVGRERHTAEFVVAAYRKPEFTVTVKPDKERCLPGQRVRMTVEASYFFGAPVAGAKVRWFTFHGPDWSSLYADPEEMEDDQGPPPSLRDWVEEYGASGPEGTAVLDEHGRAVIEFPVRLPEDAEVQTDELYTASVTVIEDSGREVGADGRVRVVPGDFRLRLDPDGWLAAPGQQKLFTVTAVDYQGRPVPATPVGLDSGYVSWDPRSRATRWEPAGSAQATTDPRGTARVPITPPRTGELRVTATATDPGGRTIRARDYVSVASDDGGDLGTEYADLSLSTDRRRYQAGQTARILINAAHTGQTVLLTVEGSRVHRRMLVPMRARSVVVQIPVLPQYGPNVFVSGCYVRGKRFSRSEATLRVAQPEKRLRVAIETLPTAPGGTPAHGPWRPGARITYRVRTSDHRGRPVPAELSFALVDEAIYSLREDSPDALRQRFYPRRHNAVQTDYSFAVEYLGDADKAEPRITARRRFPDTAYWNPVLATDQRGLTTVSLTLPDSLTTWRATAVAHTGDTALGRAIHRAVVSKEFFVRLEAPRFLAQHDHGRLLALVHNNTAARQTALVRIRPGSLRLLGPDTATLEIPPGAVGQAQFPVAAADLAHAAVRLTAWTPRQPDGSQLADGIETTIPVRPHGRERIQALAGEITPRRPETEVLRLDPSAIPSASRLTIRITPSLAASVAGAVQYLVDYPYGCTEQTLSRFLPALLVEALPDRAGLAPQRAAHIPAIARAGLYRLYKLQHPSGAWGWWQHDEDDAWMTAYALYGLAAARSQGLPVSAQVLQRGARAALEMAGKTPDSTRAFLLYAAALAGSPRAAGARRATLSAAATAPALAWTILLNRALGEPGHAALRTPRLVRELLRQATAQDGLLHWELDDPRQEWDSEMATAVSLMALLAADSADPVAPQVLRWFMSRRTGAGWTSTRATAFVLAALARYLGHGRGTSAAGVVTVRLNGQLLQTISLTANAREPEVVLRVPASRLRRDKNDVVLERTGGTTPIFYAVELRQTVAQENIPADAPPGFSVRRAFYRLVPQRTADGRWRLAPKPTENRMRQGDRIRVQLRITVPRDMACVLIEDPFPAGCEPSDRGEVDDPNDWTDWWAATDVRDDRVAFFARRLPRGEHVIEYNLRAQSPGVYHTLPALVQPMYSPAIRAESAESRVEIRP